MISNPSHSNLSFNPNIKMHITIPKEMMKIPNPKQTLRLKYTWGGINSP